MTKNARFSLLPSFIIVSAALLAGCNDQGETQAHPAEPQVTVHVVEKAPLGRVRISTLRNENETFSQLNSITYIGVFLRLVTYSHLP